MWFEAISGLKINLDNSKILPVGRVDNVKELASELGCKVGVLLMGESLLKFIQGRKGRPK